MRRLQSKNPLAIVLLTTLAMLSACAFDSSFFRTTEQSPVNAAQTGAEFSFPSRDGSTIYGLHLQSAADPQATIYLFHGSGENIHGWQELARPLVAAGYDVIMMDYRGFGRSRGKPTHANAVSDAKETVKFVEDRLRSETKILLGQSYGGQVAIRLAFDDKDYFDGLIVEGTFTSHREEVLASVPGWLGPIVGLIATSPFEARELIAEITIPKLIIHSRDDDLVPSWMGMALYKSAADQKTHWEISGRHALGLLEMPEAYVAEVNDFLTTRVKKGIH